MTENPQEQRRIYSTTSQTRVFLERQKCQRNNSCQAAHKRELRTYHHQHPLAMSPRDDPEMYLPHVESSESLRIDADAKPLLVVQSSADTVDRPKKSVSFASVHVREYNRILGDHPDVRVGPPISIGWEYTERSAQHIDDYEANRHPSGRLRLSSITRKNLLHNVFGIPEEEIRAAEKEIQKIQKQRSQTNKQGKASEKVEGAVRSAKKRFRRSGENFLKGLSMASGHMIPITLHA